MPDAFPFDVFLSHSAKDKTIVRDIAARLTKDGVRVWFDEEQIKPGDHVQARVEEGLEHSRVLACPTEASQRRWMFYISANALGSNWAQLESATFTLSRPAEQGASLPSPAPQRRPPQRLPGAIPSPPSSFQKRIL